MNTLTMNMFAETCEDLPLLSAAIEEEVTEPTMIYMMSRSGRNGSHELWFDKDTKQYIIYAYIRKEGDTYKYQIISEEGDHYNIGDRISNGGELPADALLLGCTKTTRIDQ